jgi:flagellar basal-body rod protein FlgC
MIMSLFKLFDVSGSALAAQTQRLNVVASNIANAESAAGPDGTVYKAKQVIFEALPPADGDGPSGVKVSRVVEDATAPRSVFDPKHPLADANGYVALPNVSVVDEMVNMLSASRSYQANVEIMNTAKNLLLKTLTIGQ